MNDKSCERCHEQAWVRPYWPLSWMRYGAGAWSGVCDLCWLELAERDSLARWLREAA